MNALTTGLFWAGAALNLPACVLFVIRVLRKTGTWSAATPLLAAGWALWAVSYLVSGPFWLAVPSALFAAAVALEWWRDRRRRRRKRAPRAYGAKSRALLAALVRRAREATKPRPVLRPAPGAA